MTIPIYRKILTESRIKSVRKKIEIFNTHISSNSVKFLISLLLFLWAFLFYIHIFDQKLLLGDEGVALANAWRISYGEIPNRDIFEIIPPFSFIPTAILFKIFEPSILVGRILSLILAFSLILLLNVVLNKMAADFSLKFLSISILIPFGVSYWPLPSHHWWCDIFSLLSVYLLLSKPVGKISTGDPPPQTSIESRKEEDFHTSKGNKKVVFSIIFSGFFCGLAIWTLQDQGGYLFLLLTSFFLFKIVKQKDGSKMKPKIALALFVSGFITATIPFLLWLLPTAGFSKLFQDLVLFPLTSYHNLEEHRFALLSGWNQLFSVLSQDAFLSAPIYTLSITIVTLFFLILPVISLFSFVYAKMTKINREKLFLIVSLFISGLLTALHRWSFTNIVWALPLLLPSLSFLFEGKLRKSVKIGSFFLGITALLFSVSFFRLSSPERMESICGRAGCVRTFKSNYSISVKNCVSYLEINSKEGETLFCAGFNTLINFLTQMKNPTPFNEFVSYHTDKQFEELKKAIVEKKVDWILIPKNKTPSNEKIEKFVLENYKRVYENNFCRIYKIKN